MSNLRKRNHDEDQLSKFEKELKRPRNLISKHVADSCCDESSIYPSKCTSNSINYNKNTEKNTSLEAKRNSVLCSKLTFDGTNENSDCDSDICMSDTMSDSEVEYLNNNRNFESVSDELKQKIYESCRKGLVGNYMDVGVCSICDQMISLDNMKWEKVTEKFIEICKQKLSPSSETPDALVNYYSPGV